MNLPTAPVHDLVVVRMTTWWWRRMGGRSGFSTTLLRCGSTPTMFAQKDAFLYTPATAYRIQGGSGRGAASVEADGAESSSGSGDLLLAEGAPKADKETKIEILDASGK